MKKNLILLILILLFGNCSKEIDFEIIPIDHNIKLIQGDTLKINKHI